VTVQPIFKQFLRYRQEPSYNAANPETAQEWNIKAGANGWMDLYNQVDGVGLQHRTPSIFPQGQSGTRAMNDAAPVAGAQEPSLGSLTMVVYPELIDWLLLASMGTVVRTETAGVAAKSSVAFASLATLDTQPASEEQLKFVIASSTAASGASINVIQNAVTVETITIPDSASSVDGDYYMKGNVEDGTVNNVTFTVAGTVTAGTVVVSGIKYIDNNHKVGATAPSLVIEQAARVEEGAANSEFFPGCKIPTLNFAYERGDALNLLLATAEVIGLAPTVAASTTFGNDAALIYKPFAGWTASVQIDDVANLEVVSANININSNDFLYSVSSGNQAPQGAVEGLQESFFSFTLLPLDTSRWDDYLASTVRKIEIEFLTPFFINATTPYQFKFTWNTVYPEDYTRSIADGAQGAEMTFRGVYNTTDVGSVQVDTRSRLPV
jgi:hypothetical protein